MLLKILYVIIIVLCRFYVSCLVNPCVIFSKGISKGKDIEKEYCFSTLKTTDVYIHNAEDRVYCCRKDPFKNRFFGRSSSSLFGEASGRSAPFGE